MVEWEKLEVEYLPPMSLNIKNKDAHKLAHQLAQLTGESLTEAVTEAVRERLERVQDKDKQASKLSDRLLEIGRDCFSTRLKEPFSARPIMATFSMTRKGCPNDSRHFRSDCHSPF